MEVLTLIKGCLMFIRLTVVFLFHSFIVSTAPSNLVEPNYVQGLGKGKPKQSDLLSSLSARKISLKNQCYKKFCVLGNGCAF